MIAFPSMEWNTVIGWCSITHPKRIPLKRKPADVFTLEKLIEMFDLRDVDDVWEWWWEWEETSALGYACYDLGYDFDYERWTITKDCEYCHGLGYFDDGEMEDCDACDGSGKVEIDREDLHDTPEYEKGLTFWGERLYKAWKNAVQSTLDKYFDWHNLFLEEVELTASILGKPYEKPGFRVVPQKSWEDAALRLAETDSGWGYAWHDSAKDFKDYNSARTYRQAVLDNLHVISAYGAVYGEKSMKRMQEDHFESNTRNL